MLPGVERAAGPAGARAGTEAAAELPNLDVLRALAVLLVFADHCLEVIGHRTGASFHPYDWQLGRLGVLLFFVHTSYVLMASMARCGLSGATLFSDFYIRRAFRIYPLSIFCVLSIVVFNIPRVPWSAYDRPELPHLVSNLALTTNITYTEPVLAPLWSLPIELQMYIVLPAIFVLIAAGRTTGRFWAVYALSIALALLLPALSGRFADAVYGPCFMAGVLAYLRSQDSGAGPAATPVRRLPSSLWLPALVGLVAAYLAIESLIEGIHHGALMWSTCLAAGLLVPAFAQTRRTRIWRICHQIAKYSYGIYLFHCVALWIAFTRLQLTSISLCLVVAIGITAVLAFAGFHWLEAPAIAAGRRMAARRPSKSAQSQATGASPCYSAVRADVVDPKAPVRDLLP